MFTRPPSIPLSLRCLTAIGLAALLASCGGPQNTGDDRPQGDGGMDSGGEQAAEGGDGPSYVSVAPSGVPERWIQSASFSSDGERLVFATADRVVWELDAGTGAITQRGEISGNGSLTVVQGGELVLDFDDPPRLYSVEEQIELLRMSNWSGADFIAFSPNGGQMLIAKGAEIGRWDLLEQARGGQEGEAIEDFMNRQLALSTMGLPGPVTALGIGPSGKFVVASDESGEGMMRLWNPDDPSTLTTLGRTGGTIKEIELSADASRLAAVNEGGKMTVTKTVKGGFDAWAQGLDAESVTWTPAGNLVALGTDGTTVNYTPSGDAKWLFTPRVRLRECWAAAARLACTDDKALFLLSLKTGDVIAIATAAEGKTLVATPDGAWTGDAPDSWLKGGTERSPDRVEASFGAW